MPSVCCADLSALGFNVSARVWQQTEMASSSSAAAMPTAAATTLEVVELVEKMRNICDELRASGRQVNLVPTMGSLHAGHASLIEIAVSNSSCCCCCPTSLVHCCQRSQCRRGSITLNDDERHETTTTLSGTTKADTRLASDANQVSASAGQLRDTHLQGSPQLPPSPQLSSVGSVASSPLASTGLHEATRAQRRSKPVVVVSIFSMPAHLSANSAEFNNYPKLSAEHHNNDLELCRRLGVEYVFSLNKEAVSPESTSEPSARTCTQLDTIEERYRPGYLNCVRRVVCAVLDIVKPQAVYLDEQYYELLLLVKHAVRDLNINTTLVPVSTKRDSLGGLPIVPNHAQMSHCQQRMGTVVNEILSCTKQVLEKECQLVSEKNQRDINLIVQACLLSITCTRLSKLDARQFNVEYLEIRCANDLSVIIFNQQLNSYDCAKGCMSESSLVGNKSINRVPFYARLLISVVIGQVRLTDNIEVILNK